MEAGRHKKVSADKGNRDRQRGRCWASLGTTHMETESDDVGGRLRTEVLEEWREGSRAQDEGLAFWGASYW